MTLTGPDKFSLTFDSGECRVTCSRGTPKFSKKSAAHGPKLYVVTCESQVLYVGVTTQPMRTRLRLGWKADGTSGYHGYAWRRTHSQATLSIWYLAEQSAASDPAEELETIEAEVVYLVRKRGQWPAGQTEIHFHPSTPEHRELAKRVLDAALT